MEMTLGCEEIHQVTKHYEANFLKAHTPRKVNSRGEVVAEDLKNNCSEMIFETKGVREALSREC